MKPLMGRVRCENVLDGLTPRQAELAAMTPNFDVERAKRWERTLLADVVLRGVEALRVRKNASATGRKR